MERKGVAVRLKRIGSSVSPRKKRTARQQFRDVRSDGVSKGNDGLSCFVGHMSVVTGQL